MAGVRSGSRPKDSRLATWRMAGHALAAQRQYDVDAAFPLSPKDTGSAGFVMATGELSNGETARREVRQALVDADYVDCVVRLSGQLFANTQISFAPYGFCRRIVVVPVGFAGEPGEILFIDGSKLGKLIPGSRTQKELASAEVEKMAAAYRQFKHISIFRSLTLGVLPRGSDRGGARTRNTPWDLAVTLERRK